MCVNQFITESLIQSLAHLSPLIARFLLGADKNETFYFQSNWITLFLITRSFFISIYIFESIVIKKTSFNFPPYFFINLGNLSP